MRGSPSVSNQPLNDRYLQACAARSREKAGVNDESSRPSADRVAKVTQCFLIGFLEQYVLTLTFIL